MDGRRKQKIKRKEERSRRKRDKSGVRVKKGRFGETYYH